MQWMFVLELMTEGDGPHIQLSAQCLARSHHPVNGSQMGLHLLYCLLFIVSPPELPPPLGVSPQCPAPVSAPGQPLGAFLKFSGCLSQRAVSQGRRMLGASAASPDIIASVASDSGSNGMWRQKQMSEGIQPPCSGAG